MIKPWTAQSFPKSSPIWIRQKGNKMMGASAVTSFAAAGVNIILTKGDGNAIVKGITWAELSVSCDQVLPNGNVAACGVTK